MPGTSTTSTRSWQHFDDEAGVHLAGGVEGCTADGRRGPRKAALREYWTAALAGIPDLRFTVERVYQGIDTVVIATRTRTGTGQPGAPVQRRPDWSSKVTAPTRRVYTAS